MTIDWPCVLLFACAAIVGFGAGRGIGERAMLRAVADYVRRYGVEKFFDHDECFVVLTEREYTAGVIARIREKGTCSAESAGGSDV